MPCHMYVREGTPFLIYVHAQWLKCSFVYLAKFIDQCFVDNTLSSWSFVRFYKGDPEYPWPEIAYTLEQCMWYQPYSGAHLSIPSYNLYGRGWFFHWKTHQWPITRPTLPLHLLNQFCLKYTPALSPPPSTTHGDSIKSFLMNLW